MQGFEVCPHDRATPTALLAAFIVLIFAQAALGQTSLGTITGRVRDPNDAVVPGASVRLANAQTNESRDAKTNGEGIYRFDAVEIGDYTVTFSAAGFATVAKRDVKVSANQISVVNAPLTLGVIETSVSATDQPGGLLQLEASVRGGNFTEAEAKELPVESRNAAMLGLTLPGVSSNRGGFGNDTFVVNGARGRSNNFLTDGIENNDISVAGQGLEITNPDAIKEVSVQTSNFDPEFGRAGGAVVNVITKQGTKDFHGTLSYLLDSRVDDAITSSESRDPNIAKNGLPFGIENIFSGTLGGPIRRDRTFFFVAYQEDRQRSDRQSQLVAPTEAGRIALRQLFPVGARPNVDLYLNATQNTVGVANPFDLALGNENGADRGSIPFGTYFRTYKYDDTEKQLQTRVDHTLAEKDQLSVRFILDRQATPFGATAGTPTFEGFDVDSRQRYYNFLISNSFVASPSLTNETRIAYNRIDVQAVIRDPEGPGGTLPRINIQNLTSLGTNSNFPQGRIANNYVLQDTATYWRGRHTFRAGVDVLRQIATQAAPYTPRGSITFGSSSSYTAFGNFVDNFGGSGSAAKDFGSAVYTPTLYRTAGFFQDRWQVHPLTISLGLRYEYFGTPFNSVTTPAFAGLFNVDPMTLQGPYALPNKVKADRNNFSPVVGIAYRPSGGPLGFLFGEENTVLRAGYYVGYDSFFNNIASNAATSAPNIISTGIASTTGSGSRGIPNFMSAIPTTPATLTPLSTQTVISPDLVNPYYQRWSLGIQRELPKKLVIDVSYVGSKGTKLYVNEDANPLVPQAMRMGTPADFPNCTPGTLVNASQATAQFPAGTTCPLSGRYDNLQGSRSVRTNGGSSTYHSGQIEVKRNFGNFVIRGSYTYSKLLSNMDEVFASTANGIANQSLSQTPFLFGGERADRAVSLFDRTHRASISYVMESPFMRDQRDFLGHLVGGWQLSGITTFESGVPFTVFNGLDSDAIGGAAVDRPNVNPRGNHLVRAVPTVDGQGFITGYMNPDTNSPIDPSNAYFIVNPAYVPTLPGSVPRVGTLGRNTERTPGMSNFNVSVVKRTRISGSKVVEFRTEFYNIFNHPQYGLASASPFAPAGNPTGANFIPSVANSSVANLFLRANNPNSDGGGRVIRYQLKIIF
jgi:hypothetical protein